MNTANLITRLKGKSIRLRLLEHDPRSFATRGTLTEPDINDIKEKKSELLNFITRAVQITSVQKLQSSPDQKDYAVSGSQKRILILQDTDPESRAYNIPWSRYFNTILQPTAFAKAWEHLLVRHESLRTVFRNVNGEYRQQILSSTSFHGHYEYLDLKHKSQSHLIAQSVIESESNTIFNIAEGPLVRAKLICLAEDQFLFFVCMHHTISDGWSINILVNELLAFYDAFKNSKEVPLLPLPLQFKDYAAWEQKQLRSPEARAHRDYWLQKLSGELPVLNLSSSTDEGSSTLGGVLRFSIPQTTLDRLEEKCQELQVSLFMLLLTVYKILLFRYTGESDIIVGSVLAGRDEAKLQGLIGFFVRTLAFRTTLPEDKSFTEAILQVKQTVLEAYGHQEYPFDQIMEELQLPPADGNNPVFNTMLVLQNPEQAATYPDENNTDQLLYAEVDAKFDLLLNFETSNLGLTGTIEYRKSKFHRDFIRQLTVHFSMLVDAFLHDPDQAFAAANLMTGQEKNLILGQFNATAIQVPIKTIPAMFNRQAISVPDKAAVCCENRQLTYKQLQEAANKLAVYLISEHGVKPGDHVGLMAERNEQLIVCMLGILNTGAAYVPVDPAYPDDRKEYILQDAAVKLTIISGDTGTWKPEGTTVQLEQLKEDVKKELSMPAIDPEDTAYLIYTSGSTGRPKGVVISHRNATNMLHWAAGFHHPAELQGVLAATSVCFDLSVYELFLPLVTGNSVIVIRNILIPEEYTGTIPVTLINTVPSAINELLRLQAVPRTTTTINLAGEPLSRELVNRIQALTHIRYVNNLYGPSETTTYSTWERVAPHETHQPFVGRPVANTQVYILNNQLSAVPIGFYGELYISGEGVAKGYHGRPELTEEKFIANPFIPGTTMYRTGDLGRWMPDGRIQLAGRADDQVKIRGFRIELGEITDQLLKHPDIADGIVIARTDEQQQKFLAAFFVPKEKNGNNLVPGIRKHLSGMLPSFMIPDLFMELDQLPYTPNGKIDKKKLPSAAPQPTAAPVQEIVYTDNETIIAAIWEDILGKKNIGTDENFFRIGGHSLKATRMVSRIHAALGISIPLKEIFDYPTIAALAERINNAAAIQQEYIKPLKPRPYYELSSAQKRLWVLSQSPEGSRAYNMPYVFNIPGIPDYAALMKTAFALVERHEALRTVFPVIEGEPWQKILSLYESGFRPEEIDLMGDPNVMEKLNAISAEEAKRDFNLAEGPVLNVRLVRVAPDLHFVFFNIHHINMDAWSVDLLKEEARTLYFAYLQQKPNPLKPLRIHYKEFAAWQNQLLQSEEMVQHKNYWKQRLENVSGIVDLPSDKKRPDRKVFNGKRIFVTLSDDLNAAVRQVVKEQEATLFMVMLALLKALCFQYSRKTDITIGSPISSRDQAGLEQIAGYFLNTLALRTQFSGNDSFLQLVQKVKQTTREAYEHKLYPFDHIVEDLGLNHTADQHLFNIMLAVMHEPGFAPPDNGNKDQENQSSFMNPPLMAKFDLLMSFVEFQNTIKGALEYNSDILSETVAITIMQDFRLLAAQCLANPGQPIAELSRCDDEQAKRILKDFSSNGKTKIPVTLPAMRKPAKSDFPEKYFITDADSSIDYTSFYKQVNRIANFLLSNKKSLLKKSVAILESLNHHQLIAAHAVISAGGSVCFLNPSDAESELQQRMEASGTKLIISTSNHARMANRLHWSCSKSCTLLITDHEHFDEVLESGGNKIDLSFWDKLNETPHDPIIGGGWFRSDNGQPFSQQEMDDYAENIRQKIAPLLSSDSKVLEIGCSTGITLMAIAPLVASYHGIDISEETLQITRKLIRKSKLKNVSLEKLEAKDLHLLEAGDFDCIIINSTVNHFPGHNYLRHVIKAATAKLKPGGFIFVGDIMDEQKRQQLEADMKLFKFEHPGFHTRTDFSRDLLIPRKYWTDLNADLPSIYSISISEKIYTISNELTEYRYDVLLTIRPHHGSDRNRVRKKMPVYDLGDLAGNKKINPVQVDGKQTGLLRFSNSSNTGRTIFPVRYRAIHLSVYWLQQQLYPKQTIFTDLEDYGFLFTFLHHRLVLDTSETLTGKGLQELIKKEKITTLFISPLTAILLMDAIESSGRTTWPSEIVQIIICGAGIAAEQWHRAMNLVSGRNIKLQYLFSTSATYPGISLFEGAAGKEDACITAGKPLTNHHVYLLDENGIAVPAGRDGLLYARGPAIALHTQPIPDPVFKGKYITPLGKKARWTNKGFLQISGNTGTQAADSFQAVRTMEKFLKISGLVKDVLILPAQQNKSRTVAWYVESERATDAQDLKTALRERFSDDHIPTEFCVLDQIPYLQNGLPDIDAIQVPVTTWRTETERQLTLIWSDILGHELISINKSFFETGGNSITALKLVSRINRNFSTSLLITDIFASPTIEMQAALISHAADRTGYDEIGKADEAELYPVSHAQKRMWILQTSEPDSVSYNMQQLIPVPGNITSEVLQQSLLLLAERHESLRTIFVESGEEVLQRILPAVSIDEAGIIDLSTREHAELLLPDYIRHEGTAVFNLNKGPLVRYKLFRLPQNKAVLCLSCHHIISDGWSMQVIQRDLQQIILAKINGKSPSLPTLKLQYRDFASWQIKQLSGNKLSALQKYWQQQFDGFAQSAGISADFQRPVKKTANGGSYTFIITREQKDCFKKRIAATDKEATLFMGLLSILNILIHQHSGERDIVIGSPYADRDHVNLEQLVGFFVQTLALRTQLREEDNFNQLLANIKETVLGAYKHQGYPFDMLVDTLRIPHTQDHSPLFDIMLVLQNTASAFGAEANSIQQVTTGFGAPHASKFDLVFTFDEYEDGLAGTIEFNTDLYFPGTIEVLANHFRNLISAVAVDENKQIQQYNMADAAETNLILQQFAKGNTAIVQPDTIIEMFRRQVEATPDHIAVVCKNRSLSFQELHHLSDQLAAQLHKEYSPEPGSGIGLMAKRTENMIVALLAIFKLGAVYVPIVPELPKSRVSQLCESAEPDLMIISTPELQEKIPAHIPCCYLDETCESLRDASATLPVDTTTGNHLAYIIFTSGTTGVPKGVQIEHQQICNLLHWAKQNLQQHQQDGIAAMTTASFDVSIIEMLYPLTSGARLILLEDVFELGTIEPAVNVNTLITVPSAVQELIKENKIPATIHTIGMGGEALRSELCNALYQLPHIKRVFNLYGPTETTVLSTANLMPPQNTAIPDIGRPILNTTVYILDKSLKPVPAGVSGELYIGGQGVGRGYLSKHETSTTSFIPDPFSDGRLYKTGDKASWLFNGHIRFEGRKDEQVKIRGYRIEPAEIETRLLNIDGVTDAAVVPVTENEQTVLLAAVAAHSQVDATQLREYLEAVLPVYMIPSHFVLLHALPLTANGKKDKKAIAALKTQSSRQQTTQPVLPGNEIEQRLSVAWKKVLGLDEASINDDFFKLGGHSINAIRLIGLINEEFNIQLSFKILFDLRTIAALGQEIEAIQWVTQQAPMLMQEEETIFSIQ